MRTKIVHKLLVHKVTSITYFLLFKLYKIISCLSNFCLTEKRNDNTFPSLLFELSDSASFYKFDLNLNLFRLLQGSNLKTLLLFVVCGQYTITCKLTGQTLKFY